MRCNLVIDAVRAVLQRHPELQLAFVFGSVGKGLQRPDSDVDVAVQAAFPLDAALKMALIGDVGLATDRAVDLIDLRTVGEPLLGQILAHGQRVLGSATDQATLTARHLIDAADFMPGVERLLAQRRRAWIGR